MGPVYYRERSNDVRANVMGHVDCTWTASLLPAPVPHVAGSECPRILAEL